MHHRNIKQAKRQIDEDLEKSTLVLFCCENIQVVEKAESI